MQKFYNREKELATLRAVSTQVAKTKGQLSVMVGRRRVGKTRLLNEAFSESGITFLYLFISHGNRMNITVIQGFQVPC